MRRILAVLLFVLAVVAVSGGIHLALAGVEPAGTASASPPEPTDTPKLGASQPSEVAKPKGSDVIPLVAEGGSPKGLLLDHAVRNLPSLHDDSARSLLGVPHRSPIPRMSVLLPILMYHNVRPIDFSITNAFVSSLTLPPVEFEKQLRYLKERQFNSVTLKEVAQYLEGRRSLPPRAVVLTFDDGFENNRTYAYPLLRSLGFKGTFFIITGLVGKKEYLSWEQVSELAAGGMEIGSHTVSHPDLPSSSSASCDRELVASKQTLERNLGVTVTALSYPSGSYNANVIAAAKRSGYETAVTTRYGAVLQGEKLMELPRVRIQGTDTLPTFRWRIEQYFPLGEPVSK